MVAKQRIRMANEKHSKNITQRGNVAKTSVRGAGPSRAGTGGGGGAGPRCADGGAVLAENGPGGEGVGRALAVGSLHLRGLRIR